jgi:hypothetical protein
MDIWHINEHSYIDPTCFVVIFTIFSKLQTIFFKLTVV